MEVGIREEACRNVPAEPARAENGGQELPFKYYVNISTDAPPKDNTNISFEYPGGALAEKRPGGGAWSARARRSWRE